MQHIFSLQNKVAVVTGGGSGIGEAIAKAFAAQGALVVVADRDIDNGKRVVKEIMDEKGHARFVSLDITHYPDVVAAVDEIVNDLDKIDILVNNAGIAHIGTAESTSTDDFERVMRVNVTGAFHCIKAVIPHMKKSGGGSILNLASVASVLGISDRFAYSTSKGALYTMTLSVAKDFLKDGIRCNSIAPARIHTPFVDGYLKENYPDNEKEMFEQLSKTQPIGRMGSPQEVAHLCVYLCSDEASFITGTCYPIDGGFITLNS